MKVIGKNEMHNRIKKFKEQKADAVNELKALNVALKEAEHKVGKLT